MHDSGEMWSLVAIATLLGAAKTAGFVARRLGQPAVVGEIAAGVLLGPTLLGRALPELSAHLFGSGASGTSTLAAVNRIGIVVFLFMAGAEIDVAQAARRMRQAVAVAVGGMLVPLALGATVAMLAPSFLGWEGRADRWVFALFIGTALCISALPVIAKTLIDLGVYRTDLGMTVIAAAVLNDVVGWLLFGFIVSTLSPGADRSPALGALVVVALVSGTWLLGRPLVHRALAFAERHGGGPASGLAVMMPLAFAGAAVSEALGLHAMLGAFVVGATSAGSPHFHEQTRSALGDFVTVLFAPLFFASIGLEADFVADFDVAVAGVIFGLATVGKVLGCSVAARLSGVPRREAWAIGFAMNARGVMEIVLALAARNAGLISSRTFVALVVMALATSMLSGPLIRRLFPVRARRRLLDALDASRFVAPLRAQSSEEAIRDLATAAVMGTDMSAAAVVSAVLDRERAASTALDGGVAVPHARLPGLRAPIVAIGVCPEGVAFDAPDGRPTVVVVLLLTPLDDDGAQVELLAEVARLFASDEARRTAASLSYETLTARLSAGT